MKISKILSAAFLPFLLIGMVASCYSQNGWGLVKGSSYGDEGHGIYLTYRLPGETFRDPITGRNVGPDPFPLILGYSRTVNDSHLLSGEVGWLQMPFLLVEDGTGTLQSIQSNTPQVRFAYRFMPFGGEHIIEPYLGGGVVISVPTAEVLGQRLVGVNGDMQVMAGARIQPGGPIFFQLEVPYTWANLRQLVVQNAGGSSTMTSFNLGPDFFVGQFWPLIGVGVKW